MYVSFVRVLFDPGVCEYVSWMGGEKDCDGLFPPFGLLGKKIYMYIYIFLVISEVLIRAL